MRRTLAALSIAAAPLGAMTIEDYQPLLDNSPFLSVAFKARIAAEATITDYSFNGYADIAGAWQLCLINKKDGLASWHAVGADVGGHKITDFNPDTQTITFEKEGISSTIILEQVQ